MNRVTRFAVIGALILSGFNVSFAAAEAGSPFEQIKGYTGGDDGGALRKIEALVQASLGDVSKRAAVEGKLIGLLESDASYICKQFVCRQLRIVGSRKCVPVLAKMVVDPKLSNMARYALEANPDGSAGEALRKAFGATSGMVRIGVINSMGERRDPKLVKPLASLISDKDANTVAAAIAALGKIGGKEAYDAIGKAADKTGGPVTDALLLCADAMVTKGKGDAARKIYTKIHENAASPQPCRMAALRAMLAMDGEKAVPRILELLAGNQEPERLVAVEFVRKLPGQKVTGQFAAKLKDLPAEGQGTLIGALADRGDAAAVPAVLEAAKHPSEPVRLAALRAFGMLEASDAAVELLVKCAATAGSAERNAAQESLIRAHGPKVEPILIERVSGPDAPTRIVAIQTLSERDARQALPAIQQAAADADATVRMAAVQSLGRLAGAAEYDATVKLLAAAKTDKEREVTEQSVLAIAPRVAEVDARTASVISLLPSGAVPTKATLLAILSKLGGTKALAAVRGAVKDADAAVQDAAIKALAAWPDIAALEGLLEVAGASQKKEHRTLAIAAYIRLMGLPSDRSSHQALEKYKKVMEVAADPEDKKLVIAALGSVTDAAALQAVETYKNDPALKTEAEKAADKIKKALEGPPVPSASHNNENAKNALDGNPDTRWETGTAMQPGMWFMLDLKSERLVKSVKLDTRKSENDFPRGYEMYVTNTPDNPGPAVATGKGEGAVMTIKPGQPARGRYVKIVQTGKTDGWYWSIHELKIETE